MSPSQWFAQVFWKNRGADQRAVLDQWQRLGELRLVLEDIALRGGVLSAAKAPDGAPPLTEAQILILEGRRQMALEIIKHAGLDPMAIWRSIQQAQIEPQKPNFTHRRMDP